jgi:hypothetical protein
MTRDPTAAPKKISCFQTPIVTPVVGVGVGVGDAEVAVGEGVAVGVAGPAQPTSKDKTNATVNTASAILFNSVPPFCVLLSSIPEKNEGDRFYSRPSFDFLFDFIHKILCYAQDGLPVNCPR